MPACSERRFLSVVLAAALALLHPVAAAGRSLYFADPSQGASSPLDQAILRYQPADSIDLDLILRAHSLEDRNSLPRLVIDDYRYDEPHYFADGRVPNVRFEVLVRRRDGEWIPASYRVASQGGGADVQFLGVNVWFRLGRSPLIYWIKDHLWYLGGLIDNHAPGTYTIRAIYGAGPSAQPDDLATPPVTILIE